MKRLLVLLLLLVPLSVQAATKTVTTPLPDINLGTIRTDLQNFLAQEDAARYTRVMTGFVYSGGLGPTTVSGLSHTVPAVDGIMHDGFYVQQADTVLTYTDTRRTFVYADSLDVRTPEVTASGGSGCTFKARATRLVQIECSAGSTQPTVSVALLPLFYADTSAGKIATVTNQRPAAPGVHSGVIYASAPPYNMKCDGATDDTLGLQYAISALSFDPGTLFRAGEVIIPGGTCIISTTIRITDPIIFSGVSRGRSLLQYNGNTPIDLIIVTSGHFAIRDLAIKTTLDNHTSTHIHVQDGTNFAIDNVTSYAVAPTLQNKIIGILINCTAGGQVPSRGFGTIRNYVYSGSSVQGAVGSRGIKLDGSGPCASDGVKYVSIEGSGTNIEDAEIGIHFVNATFNKISGPMLLQGNTTHIQFNTAQVNRVSDVRYQQAFTQNNNIDGSSTDNIFEHLSMSNPTAFGTDTSGLNIRPFQADATLTSQLPGVYTFTGTPTKDGWIVVKDDFQPTITAMNQWDRGSQVAKDILQWGINGCDGGAISVGGYFKITGCQSQAGSFIKWHRHQQATIDFGNILAGGQAESTVAFTGVAIGDTCYGSVDTIMESSILLNYYVSGAGNVVVRAINTHPTNAVDPAAHTFEIDCWRH
jgi:Pectate lyase superfamily protein